MAKIKALSALLSDINTTSKSLTEWLKAHQSDSITLDGISMPLIDIFTKYTTEMQKVSLCLNYAVL